MVQNGDLVRYLANVRGGPAENSTYQTQAGETRFSNDINVTASVLQSPHISALLKLYEMGEIDDEYFLRESNTLRAEKAKVEEQINCPLPIDTLPNITDLQQACGGCPSIFICGRAPGFSS